MNRDRFTAFPARECKQILNTIPNLTDHQIILQYNLPSSATNGLKILSLDPSSYESSENMTITCSTKVCSFGKQVVEKVEVSMILGSPKVFVSSFKLRCVTRARVTDRNVKLGTNTFGLLGYILIGYFGIGGFETVSATRQQISKTTLFTVNTRECSLIYQPDDLGQ